MRYCCCYHNTESIHRILTSAERSVIKVKKLEEARKQKKAEKVGEKK